MTPSFTISDVVSRGMCVGCGACGVATGGRIPVTISRRGAFEADLDGVEPQLLAKASKVCPFSDDSKNEDVIAGEVFAPALPVHSLVGRYSTIYAGRLTDTDALLQSSSGGLTSWVAIQLLEQGHVDGVLHVGRSPESEEGLFAYQVSYASTELLANRKSDYYATTFAEMMNVIRGDGRRYAVIGVPCFIRSARLVADEDSVLKGQLAFFLGLVCGHLKSTGFAESLAWQVGVAPDELESVDFRIKVEGRSSANYDFGARARASEIIRTAPTASLVGGSWGHAMFQVNACNFCDDIFAETADASFGDAWLPEYRDDAQGRNIVVSRHPVIDAILADGEARGVVTLDVIDAERAALSQSGNYRHRRVGLSVRLADDTAAGLRVPVKRVEPSLAGIDEKRVRLIRLRRRMAEVSHESFAEAKQARDLSVFLNRMKPLVEKYKAIDSGGSVRSTVRKVQRRLSRVLKRG